MGKTSKRRLTRREVESATLAGCEEKVARAQRERERMELAHRHLQKCSHERLQLRAAAVLAELPSEHPTRPFFANIKQTGKVKVIVMTDEGQFRAATVGLGLLGQPELLLRWPEALKEQASDVMHDLIISCCEGEGASKLYDMRSVYAMRLDLAYKMHATACADEEFCRGMLSAATAAYAVEGVPKALTLELVADMREGVLLSKGFKAGLAVYRNKNGVSTFTGLVRVPIPSRSWAAHNYQFCHARLADYDGDLEGPCTIITPAEYMDVIRDYD